MAVVCPSLQRSHALLYGTHYISVETVAVFTRVLRYNIRSISIELPVIVTAWLGRLGRHNSHIGRLLIRSQTRKNRSIFCNKLTKLSYFHQLPRNLTANIFDRTTDPIHEDWLASLNFKNTFLHHACCVVPYTVAQVTGVGWVTRDLQEFN